MILFLTDRDQDYAADYLYDGFCSMLGPSAVIDYPVKPSLHGEEQAVFDCDLAWPAHGLSDGAIFSRCAQGGFDLVVVPSLRRGVMEALAHVRSTGGLATMAGRIVALDGEDRSPHMQHVYEEAVGERVVYFKREVPLTDTTTRVLPFGYPAARVMLRTAQPEPSVFASWQVWGWAKGGVRDQLAKALTQLPVRRYVECFTDAQYSTGARLSPRAYHAHAQRCTVGVAPAGAGYFTNRLFELVADGCAVVAERPTVQFPNAFRDGIEVLYFDDAEHALRQVKWLLDNPDIAARVARAAQMWLLEHHTTRRRAEEVWRTVHGRA